jgi:hypothetical protein
MGWEDCHIHEFRIDEITLRMAPRQGRRSNTVPGASRRTVGQVLLLKDRRLIREYFSFSAVPAFSFDTLPVHGLAPGARSLERFEELLQEAQRTTPAAAGERPVCEQRRPLWRFDLKLEQQRAIDLAAPRRRAKPESCLLHLLS